ncbi:serine endopeptidase [Colletotrichum truncatum]|uniref:Serine endopeptidase n=2 Tax=Colletotrichum truncatum TaxID=5467 RepID=A0ACC3YTE7_COLTU
MRHLLQAILWLVIPSKILAARQYIVEVSSVDHIKPVADSIDHGISCLQDAKIYLRHQYESLIFPGISVRIDNSDNAEMDYIKCLNSITGVVKTWRSESYSAASRNESNNASASSSPIGSNTFHSLTGVKQLHDRGIFGQGLTIAIVDEGIDYYHPALGGGYGKGHKVQFGVDLVGDNWTTGDIPRMDQDPYSECTAHGSHVSGIAAGNHSALGFVGVAPEATLEHYRISGCQRAPIASDVILKAITMAHNRNVDVLSLSLTLNTGPYPDDPVSEVLTRISKEGKTLVVVASGNYGWQGPFSASSPASATDIMAVGSVNQINAVQSRPRAKYKVGAAENNTTPAKEFPWTPATPGRFPAFLILQTSSLNMTVQDDACTALPANSRFDDNAVVLTRRGGCKFSVKMENLVAKGARYVLLYDNVEGPLLEFDNTFDGISAAGSVTAQTGLELIQALATGTNVTMMMDSDFQFDPYVKVGANTLPPGQINGRGSWGPAGLGDIMPSILAPGQNIWSTFPRSWGGYGTLSGTSMAAPYISGCLALMKQARPSLNSSEIMRLLTSTAHPLAFNDGTNKTYDFLAPVWQQGNGIVNATRAIDTNSLVSTSNLAFNDTEYFTGKASFQVHNQGNESVEYEVVHKPAVTVQTFLVDRKEVVPWTRDNSSSLASDEFLQNLKPRHYANVTTNSQKILIRPGESATIQVTADITNLEELAPDCPLYSGFIHLDGNDTTRLTISYGGIGCSLRHVAALPPGWNRTYVTAATVKQAKGEKYNAAPIPPNMIFHLEHNTSAIMRSNSSDLLPTLNLQLAFPSKAVSVHVLSATAQESDEGMPVFPADKTTAKLGGFGRTETSYFGWNGILANGTLVAEGSYTFRVCALGGWEKPVDLNVWNDCVMTTPFIIKFRE